jgi:transcriptional regulator with XRE-family HTH domain
MTGTELAEIRHSLNLKQRELAALLGIHIVTLGNYETDARPIPKTVELAVQQLATRHEAESPEPTEA